MTNSDKAYVEEFICNRTVFYYEESNFISTSIFESNMLTTYFISRCRLIGYSTRFIRFNH